MALGEDTVLLGNFGEALSHGAFLRSDGCDVHKLLQSIKRIGQIGMLSVAPSHQQTQRQLGNQPS